MATGRVVYLPPVFALHSKSFLIIPIPSPYESSVLIKMAALRRYVVVTVGKRTFRDTIDKGRV